MKSNSKIKVIKKNEVKTVTKKPTVIEENNCQKGTARRLGSTISGWINEFQECRGMERKLALKRFYEVSPSGLLIK